MSIHHYAASTPWTKITEFLAIGLTGWIPKKPGMKLRYFIYQKLLAKIGHSVKIERGVSFSSLHRIELGNEVTIAANVLIDSASFDGLIEIGDRVSLAEKVQLKTHGSHARIRLQTGVRIERETEITVLNQGWVEIGENTQLGSHVCMVSPGQIQVGKNCSIGSYFSIYYDATRMPNHPNLAEGELMHPGIVIEDNCQLGDNVTVLYGTTIRQGSVLAAGSVVSQDVL